MAEGSAAERQAGEDEGALSALVRRARTGEVAAYEALVHRFQDLAVGYAYARLGDLHLAEDAAQEAFLRAYRDLPALRDPAAFPGWFRRILAHRCDRLTRGKRVRVVPLEVAAGVAAAGPGPAELVVTGERRERVRRAVRGLPETERAAIVLFYLGGYSHAEVARFLGLPQTTVNNRLHAARKRLERSLLTMAGDDLQDGLDHLHASRPSRDPSFAGRVLRTLAPQAGADGARIYDALEARTAGWGRTQWREGRVAHSHFDWATSRIGLVEERLVTVFGVYDVTMRIGTARVRVAGVNLEYTDPDFHHQDVFAQTAAASLGAMRQAGYDLSVAFGREPFYFGLGYTAGWRENLWLVRTRDLPGDPPGFPLEAFDPVHRDDLAALYNREHEGLTGTAVRPTYLRNKHPGDFVGHLWRNADGTPRGYVMVGPERTTDWRNPAILGTNHRGYESLLWHDESAGDVEERLRVLGYLARRLDCAEVILNRLHYLSPLARRLRQLPCRLEEGYRRYVVRIVNLQTLMEKLTPELSRRLRASPLAAWDGALALATADERVILELAGGGVRVRPDAAGGAPPPHAVEGGPALAQLVVGGEAPQETVEAGGITLRGEAGRLLDVLFPAQHPQMDNQAL